MDKETNEIIKEIFKMYESMALDSNVLALIKVLKKWYFEKEDYKERIDKATEYIKDNCILSDAWTELDFCNFVPTGRIKYKQLSSKKVKDLLDILIGSEE